MNKEIGSEFWNDGPPKKDKVYLLAGRTALDYIIRDIKKSNRVNSALLPSYCCHTMIEPFIRNNIAVRFYDVYFDKSIGVTANISHINENEIFYYIEYFGFSKINGIDIGKIKSHKTVIIEDCTHSWMYRNRLVFSDYAYSSYRKWTGFDALAVAEKKDGYFDELPNSYNDKYVTLRKLAANLKKAFIENNEGDKTQYLTIFAMAEELLEKDYVGYLPTDATLAAFLNLDKNLIAVKRRENAKFIIDEIGSIPQIELMYSELSEEDIPLFVPILVKDSRDDLRKFLIDNQIYCPVHWPISHFHNGISDTALKIYDEELSIICDQRYGLDDIKRMTDVIKQFYKR